MNNFIPCAKWIRRGVAKSKPEFVKLSKRELRGLVQKAKSEILETAESIQSCNETTSATENSGSDQYGMEDYDKEDDVQCLVGIGNLISMDDGTDGADSAESEEEDESDSDKEDDEIKSTDNLIAVGHVHGDVSVLEVYVFNEKDDDLYVHHDIVLPTIPLTLEWLSYLPGQEAAGNLLAMGGMTPEITIWDLDVVNCLEPLMKLGEFSNKKKYQHRNHGHRDAVLDLAWNPNVPHVMASGSVDRTVLLWDLVKARAITKFTDFQEKVQSIDWHPSESSVLVAGSCDGKVNLLDCRTEDVVSNVTVDGEVEKVVWHPNSNCSTLIGTSKGMLSFADCRTGTIVWEVRAHEKEVTGLAIDGNSVVTCSTDQTVKVWRVSDIEPKLVYTKHTNQGEIHCVQMCPENSSIVCVGGTARDNNFRVYNLSSEMNADTENQDMEMES